MNEYRTFKNCKELIERWRRNWREARRFYEEYDYNLSYWDNIDNIIAKCLKDNKEE